MMANAVNHLLRVGFYLINFGFVALFLRLGTKPASLVEAIEYIASKIGIVLLVLGHQRHDQRQRAAAIRHRHGRRGRRCLGLILLSTREQPRTR